MANPRIDDLRKRMEREPGSRLFAQLAEELRKDAALVEAVRVCREGLQRHPTYWSARLTLGRCLADSGDRRGAVEELRSVLQASPDNLMAGRLLAECQEALEDFAAAAETYALLLPLAPGDKQLKDRLADAQTRAAASARQAQLSSAEMQDRFAPIPLVEADESFELERFGEGAVASGRGEPAPASVPPPVRVEATSGPEEMVFEFETGRDRPAFEPEFRPLDEAALLASRPPSSLPATVPGIMLSDLASPALASATLAELYQQQGATDRAIETYREVLKREPGNAKAQERLAELQRPVQAPALPSRRAVIERTIARLEAFAAVLQRG